MYTKAIAAAILDLNNRDELRKLATCIATLAAEVSDESDEGHSQYMYTQAFIEWATKRKAS